MEIELTTLDGTHVGTLATSTDSSVAGDVQRTATFADLEPDTGYCYSLRGLTAPAGFRTAPAPGSGAAVRFAAWGDSGYAGGASTCRRSAVLGSLTRSFS